MAYTKYSLTPADNNAAPPNGAPEGMLPSAVNDTMRDMMAQIRDVGDGIRGGTYTMTAPVITGGSVSGATGSFSTLAASGTTTLSANQIISVTDNSNAALRITQLGTGNALLVEDSTNPDSTPFVIDSVGNVIKGNDTAILYSSGLTPQIQLNIAGAGTMGISRWSANSSNNALVFLKSRGATIGDYAVVSSGDNLGAVNFYGADGTAGILSAQILSSVDGTPGTNDMPGRLVFSTTADGASTPTERMRIDSAGRVDMRSTMTDTGSGGVSSISGTTLTVGGTVTGTFNVGDRIFGVGVEPNTFITALGTGTGGAGTYTINNSQTTGSTAIRAIGPGLNTFRFTDTDTAVLGSQPMGIIEWFGSDASTPSAGVKAYIAGISESTTPDTALIFGTSNNVADTQAVERWRIDSTGILTAKTGSGLSISATGVTSPAATDGNVFSGTYTPTLTNTTNIAASTAAVCQYMRVGNVVTVSGTVQIDPTLAGQIVLGMTLPIASALTAATQCGGTFAGSGVTTINLGSIVADATNDRATFDGVVADIANRTYGFTFTYLVI
jgi:hypothetical protein